MLLQKMNRSALSARAFNVLSPKRMKFSQYFWNVFFFPHCSQTSNLQACITSLDSGKNIYTSPLKTICHHIKEETVSNI
jgi:hypothetical protein